MRTVKQVSELTGISIRTLHYYDEIGLFKPSEVTESGYRLYDDNALQTLQQILFFRELDFPLEDIKLVMLNPNYDKKQAFENQRRLLRLKRDRLDDLLAMLDKLIEGEEYMSFKEFDMSEYTNALEEFIETRSDEIIRYGGDLEEFNHVLETLKSDDPKRIEAAKMAIRQYGSIEKYTEAMKKNMENFPEVMKQMYSVKDDAVNTYVEKSNELMKRLTVDLDKDAACEEVQRTVEELVALGETYSNGIDMGDNYWRSMADSYTSNPAYIEVTDRKYGKGASAFIGNALKAYCNTR